MKLKDFDFRVFEKIRGELIYFNLPKTSELFNFSFNADDEIELWSGFYDSKGAKIYEGDIVKYDSRANPLVVVFERNTFYIVDTNIEKYLQVDCGTRLQGIYNNGDNGYKDNKLECVEVIGNIHETQRTHNEERIHNKRFKIR